CKNGNQHSQGNANDFRKNSFSYSFSKGFYCSYTVFNTEDSG
ncbi:hypothetical protein PEC301296_25540, partial [Pectobacterium carotovorum subsp. carotovorum]